MIGEQATLEHAGCVQTARSERCAAVRMPLTLVAGDLLMSSISCLLSVTISCVPMHEMLREAACGGLASCGWSEGGFADPDDLLKHFQIDP